MRDLVRGKAILYLVLIFVAGLAAGGAGGFAFRKTDRPAPPDPQAMVEHIVGRLQHELALTEEQVAQIRPLVQDTSAKINALHENMKAQVGTLIQENNRRMAAFLTPDQQAKLAELERHREQRSGKDAKAGRAPAPGEHAR